MAVLDPTAPDIAISYDGDEVTYKLVRDENGVIQWFPTFIDEVPQENRSAGSAFSYNDAPRTVSQVLDFADWSLGAGFVDAPAGTTSFGGYSYSQGVDASEGKVVLSPKKQAMDTGADFDGMYLSPTFGAYAWSGTALYLLAAGDWVLKYTAAVPIPKHAMQEYGNSTDVYLFLALGPTQDAVYSIDGFATAPSTVTSFKTSFFTVRGNTSVEPVMIACTTDGLLRTSTNPIANANWSNADRIGSAGETVTSILTANDIVWIFKEEGYYTFDGTNVGSQVPVDQLKRTGNGAQSFVWINGFIYVNYANRLLEINPFENSTRVLLAPAHPEINGDITAITGDTRWLYVFVGNADSNTYCLKVSPESGVAHTYFYVSGATTNAALVSRSSGDNVSATNDAIVYAATTAFYVILPRDGLQPWDDSNYRFDPAGGFLVGANVDAGVPTFEKWVNGAKELTESTTGARAATLFYDLEAANSFTQILSAVAPGITEEIVSSNITFTRLRYKLALTTGDEEHSPRVIAVMFSTTPNPPRYRAWRLTLDIGDQQRRAGGGEPRGESYKRLLNHLNGAVGQRVTYTDFFGDSFMAKVMNVSVQGVQWVGSQNSRNTAQSNVEVVIAEISENDTMGAPFIWGSSIWSGGGEWS